MKVNEIISQVKAHGNSIELSNNLFIKNHMIRELLHKVEEDVLITPYYIDENNKIYELHYSELNIKFVEGDVFDIIKFKENSLFSEEFKKTFHPQIIVGNQNKNDLKKYLEHYYESLEKFNFDKEFNINIKGNLFFEIF